MRPSSYWEAGFDYRNDNRKPSRIRTMTSLLYVIVFALAVVLPLYAAGLTVMTRDIRAGMELTAAQEQARQQRLFSSCLTGNYLHPEKSKDCAQLARNLVLQMNAGER